VRIAIVSDVHGNLTALDAVLADLRAVSPDLVLHGGDLGEGGARPAEVVQRIRDLGWRGVLGNVDEMTARPDSFEEFVRPLPQLETTWSAIREMADWTRDQHTEEQIQWLGALPLTWTDGSIALLHASPTTTWRSPTPESKDEDFEATYQPLSQSTIVYGHIHRPFVRKIRSKTIVNSGSVGLPYDGDQRACYLVWTDGSVEIRRVAYDVERELEAVRASGIPHPGWLDRMLRSAKPEPL
jgi:putative phosphoesterase